jgi:uncharacterized protein YerC
MQRSVKERLFDLFWKTITSLKTKEEVIKFFKGLLTPTEQTVQAKRFGIAIPFLKGYNYSTIKDTLKVSSSTINKIQLWLKSSGEGYKRVVGKIIKGERAEDFKDDLKVSILRLFSGGYPEKGRALAGQKRLEVLKKKLKRSGL